MKIISRDEFLKLPEGTIFSKYEYMVFGPLSIKGDSLTNPCIDFFELAIAEAVDCWGPAECIQMLDSAEHKGTSFAMDLECMGRDGLFEKEQLFAVWEKEELLALIGVLQKAIKEGARKASLSQTENECLRIIKR